MPEPVISPQVFKTTQELAKNSEFVVTMLPNNDIVKATYEEMISDGVNGNTMFIDSSTVDPGVSQYVQKIVKEKGASFVDAPVSGGVMGAQNATLTFMVAALARNLIVSRTSSLAWEEKLLTAALTEWVKLQKFAII